jgi:acyl-CoA thioesterase
MLDLAAIPAPLRLEQLSDNRFVCPPINHLGERTVIFAGQFLAQSMLAAGLVVDGTKEVGTVHLVLAKAGNALEPVEYQVEMISHGRTIATSTVTFTQAGRILGRALVLQSADEPDFVHYSNLSMPDVPPPPAVSDSTFTGIMLPGATAAVVGEGPPDDRGARAPYRNIWLRYPGPVASHLVAQAVLAFGSFGLLGPTGIRHAPGLTEYDMHRTVMGAILTHTVHFFERFRLEQSLLLACEATWAGRGRMHGHANIFSREGRLVAAFTNDAVVKPFPDGRDHSEDYNTVL